MTAGAPPHGPGIRPLRWEPARPPAAAGPAATNAQATPPWFDSAAFLAQFAPDLSRTIGTRIGLRASPAPEAPVRLIRALQAKAAAAEIALDLDRATIALLLERMCGGRIGRGGAQPEILSQLSPQAASWRGLSTCLSRAFCAGLAAALATAPPIAQPVPRIEEVPRGPGTRLWFALGVEGMAGWLTLLLSDRAQEATDGEAPGAEPRSQAASLPEPSAWSERAARFLDRIELPVGVRLAEQRLPLALLLSLAPGSILPIDRPEALLLLVGGKPWREIDTRLLNAQPAEAPMPDTRTDDRPIGDWPAGAGEAGGSQLESRP